VRISDFSNTYNLRDRSADILVRLAEWVNPKANKMSALQKNLRCAHHVWWLFVSQTTKYSSHHRLRKNNDKFVQPWNIQMALYCMDYR